MRWGAGSLKRWEEAAELEFSTQGSTFPDEDEDKDEDELSSLQTQTPGERITSSLHAPERSQALVQAGGTWVCTAE